MKRPVTSVKYPPTFSRLICNCSPVSLPSGSEKQLSQLMSFILGFLFLFISNEEATLHKSIACTNAPIWSITSGLFVQPLLSLLNYPIFFSRYSNCLFCHCFMAHKFNCMPKSLSDNIMHTSPGENVAFFETKPGSTWGLQETLVQHLQHEYRVRTACLCRM